MRPLTREQCLQNRDFLTALRRTGNIRLAAREVGLKYGTVQHRRRVQPVFAQQCEAALVLARARLGSAELGPRVRGDDEKAWRTAGGEPHIVRLKDGSVQIRRAQPNKLTRACEQAFLSALSATANVTLSAAASGASPRAFYRRKRQCPAFAREMRLALQTGYDRIEEALLESTLAAAHEHDAWRSNDPPAIPPMSANQALQLMYLHQKEARLTADPWPIKRQRGEPREVWLARLAIIAEERDRLAREAFEIAEAERHAGGEPAWGEAGEDVRRRLALPDLAQVMGWSRADPDKAPHDPDTALFGGWRILPRDAERWGADFEEIPSQRAEPSSAGRRAAKPTRSTSRDLLP